MRILMKKDKITDHSETRNIDEVLHVSPLQAHQRLPGQQNEWEKVLVINNDQILLYKGVLKTTRKYMHHCFLEQNPSVVGQSLSCKKWEKTKMLLKNPFCIKKNVGGVNGRVPLF